jgi:hypothetical protein
MVAGFCDCHCLEGAHDNMPIETNDLLENVMERLERLKKQLWGRRQWSI